MIDSPVVGLRGLAVGDLDGDGRGDLAYGKSFSQLVWPRNLGGVYAEPVEIYSGDPVSKVVPADMDGDGELDIVFASGRAIYMALNRRSGRFDANGVFRAADGHFLFIPDEGAGEEFTLGYAARLGSEGELGEAAIYTFFPGASPPRSSRPSS